MAFEAVQGAKLQTARGKRQPSEQEEAEAVKAGDSCF